MIALLSNVGQMFLMLLGSSLKCFLEFFDLKQKVCMTITAICKPFECFNRQASDYVFHF